MHDRAAVIQVDAGASGGVAVPEERAGGFPFGRGVERSASGPVHPVSGDEHGTFAEFSDRPARDVEQQAVQGSARQADVRVPVDTPPGPSLSLPYTRPSVSTPTACPPPVRSRPAIG